MISLIAAIGKNRELGRGGELVFRLKGDMQFFRETTRGHTVVMGRKTWESLPRKLPERVNIVLSRGGEVDGADETLSEPEEILRRFKDGEEEVFIIGGEMVYREFLPYADCLYLTEVEATAEADTFFPEFDKDKYHREIIKKGAENGVAYTISRYKNKF